ncbi:hypothetical protein VOLCADRAFT_99891 [Volvox carteri f. nagariensis]|uniref:AB hydrolase-1 domain-containing protein n=1 Tax=Volvox carteri f. nagariensis TaxID=3068 RepID=D8UIW9_VOLCA|nr:uncharacterized protein VOLCADRAFT_99891 [Volvox carteri f. nagariensis]EFJ40349.1 hypothetical protein VOLCADRAFT_99891 [Volvox carteri f. nagariensis]|eukprot:XP_002958612.1 hypothetical protein VOLCADRAFT_99891 [Volvox carteri f. nagariensis]
MHGELGIYVALGPEGHPPVGMNTSASTSPATDTLNCGYSEFNAADMKYRGNAKNRYAGGYGTGSLDRDAADLHLLCQHLRRHHDVSGVVLLGHSTGCQDTVRYVQRYGPSAAAAIATAHLQDSDSDQAPELLATILQAPRGPDKRRTPPMFSHMQHGRPNATQVSDHEWLSQYPELEPLVRLSRELAAAGRGEEVVGRLLVADGAPISASRLLSLYDLGGDDDMFSEELPSEAVQRILGPLGCRPCLLLVSGADECVPHQDRIVTRAESLQTAIGSSACLHVVPGAPHNLAGFEEAAAAALQPQSQLNP